MPLDDNTEYKFPDETTQEATEIEIEIEDDTPTEDRGRQPLPKPLVEELEKDELDQYDDTVKTKLKQMRKVWHDERREKESALRGRGRGCRDNIPPTCRGDESGFRPCF